MVILMEKHRKALNRAKLKTLAVCAIFLALMGMMSGYMKKLHNETRIAKAECETWANEAKGLMAKNELLNVLKSKPMTIGQAMEVIDAVANQRVIPISIVLAMVEQESEFHPRAVSHMGARGLTQVMPATLRYYIKDPALQKQIDRPSVNVTGGLMHLAYLNSQYGTWEKSLRAYFAGEDHVNNKDFDWYQKSVLRKASKYKRLE